MRIGWNELNPVVGLANYLPCEPGFAFGPRTISDYQMIYVLQGKGTGAIQKRSYSVVAGDLLCYGPGIVHRFQADRDDPFALYGMHFQLNGALGEQTKRTIAAASLSADGPDNMIVIGHPGDEEEFYMPEKINVSGTEIPELFGEIVRRFVKGTSLAPFAMRGLLTQLFLELTECLPNPGAHRSPLDQLLDKVKVGLEQHAQLSYDRHWLQMWTGYNEDYLSRSFRTRFGLSPHLFHSLKKIEAAKMMLAFSNDSITELAERLHYQSVHYFSRAFKAHVGRSPSDYRRLHRLF